MVKTWNESRGCYDVVTDSRELEVMTRAIAEAAHSLRCAPTTSFGASYYVKERHVEHSADIIGAALDAAGFNAEGGLKP